MILLKIPFVNKKHYSPGSLPQTACGSSRRWSAVILKNSKWRSRSDYSSSSEDDEYSDPLEVAASAGARLSRKSQYQVCFVQSRGYRNCWFSHDVTKIQTKKLSILPRFYFHDALEQLKTNCQTNFRFKRVLGFVIEYA